ncbi:hypothetical protein M493_02585 [Geobacillus genomosp. 3]|uniref:Uncharacterized protein n=1 Tax=Geobacillus genomosp. 3 TaxID=1921421 RepID=S5Z9L8_GEOG3|nr:hypothetical protein [Geobacillus genomosp. 3]AGT30850.1 hypothetical protein M493_02585 [Geobacillus genomosp. 3]
MKRNVFLVAVVGILVVCAAVFPWQPVGMDKTKEPSASFRQRIIIRDSVDQPLSPHVKQAGAMETTSEPQLLPNVDLDRPIVITKMPHIEKTKKN